MEQAERPGEVIGAYHAALEPFWHPVLPTDSLSNRPTADTLLERIRFVKDSSAGTYVIWRVACPDSYDRSLILSCQARSFDTDPAREPEYERLRDTILEQDRPFVESQRPGLLPPLSPRMMLYVRPIGLPLVAFQKRLEELQIPQEV